MSDHDWVEVFTHEFELPESAVQARIWADVLGDEYPAEVAPYGYTTRTELQFGADALAVGSGDVLVDIGCGRGGPAVPSASLELALRCATDTVRIVGERAEHGQSLRRLVWTGLRTVDRQARVAYSDSDGADAKRTSG
jgi:hypothetical protein